MANKRLSLQDIQQMKTMVKNGVAPEDIAKHFSIAISSVHNYKNRFKAEGMTFPDVRGKRPTGSVQVQSRSTQHETPSRVTTADKPADITMDASMKFVVNGVSVQVSGEAKNVNISKDHIEINF